ncbi:MAG: hypothetical protein ACREMN_10890, partial [Gemmatimonadales bacterium]
AVIAVAAAGILLRNPAHALDTRRVAVAALENRTADASLDNLGLMAADWVTQGLAQTGLVEVVPSVSLMTTASQSGRAGLRDAAAIQALGRATGAGTVVTGGYYRQGDSVRFHVQITAADDGTVLRALEPVVGSLAEPLHAVEILRQRVTAALATLFDARLNRWAMTASQPPTLEAYQHFIAGLDRFVQLDPPGAIEHFERAAAADTAFWLPLIFAANAHMNIGAFAAAESLAHVVAAHSAQLAPLDRAYLAWVLAICRGDREAAYQASRAMADLAPASETVYLLAGDALSLNRPRAAVEALRGLGPDRGFTRGWWVYWDDLTTALHMLGEHRDELKEAAEGRRRFPESLHMLTAQARALAALGRTAEVRRLLAAGGSFETELGWSPADAMLLAAAELRAHGQPPAADSVLATTRRWLTERAAADSLSPVYRYRVAVNAFAMGRLDEARREFERLSGRGTLGPGTHRAHRTHPIFELPAEQLEYLGHLGAIAAREQNRADALQVAATLAELRHPFLFGRHTLWRARIHAWLGERDVAVALVREGMRQGYPNMPTLHADPAFAALRDYPPFQALLTPKG